MYCQSAEQTLKLLKPIIDTTVHSDISADEELRKLFEELGQSVDELRELFENWHPLSSKFYFKLKASQQCLPDDMTSIIKEAINEQLEGEDSFSGVDNAQHVDPVRISDEESVDLVSQSSTSPSRREASNALRSEQSQNHRQVVEDNKIRIGRAGAIKPLVELLSCGCSSKSGQQGGIPLLVEVVELGSTRGKENAAAALLHLNMVLQEGAVPPLVALSPSGTARAKEKFSLYLLCFVTKCGD
ncbi:hypothetical protein AAHE18_06G008500 [Arachis hypogaea]